MLINPLNMFNYQVINNNTNVVGIIHSYVEKIVTKDLANLQLKLYRNNKKTNIIHVALKED